jgi:dephospho-CoA kinase
VAGEANDRDERRPTLVLVTGLPGAGKSTVAEATAEVLGAAVLGHDWMIILSPGLINEATPSALAPDGQTFNVCAQTCATP